MPRLITFCLLAAGALFCATAGAQGAAAHRMMSQPVPDRYMVVYKDSVADPDEASDRAVRVSGGQRHHVYRNVLKGFAATLSPRAVQLLAMDPDVAYIEQDERVSISGVETVAAPGLWGLDRVDQRDFGRDQLYHYNATGTGVYAFIIDTGIRADHSEFSGRVVAGFTAINDGNSTTDCNGHGTHVSGTVGGSTYGIAKNVTLVPVRVLDCSGSGMWSGVVSGIDWAAGQKTLRPAVANMSLGGSRSTVVNSAVARAVAAGITMAVAAGNENADACTKSPASEPSAITVGAATDTDARASFSNWGTCVDLFAPGVAITSSWNTGASDTKTISGTSMATPHVTGVAALVLEANPGASPVAVAKFIVDNATPNKLVSINAGSPNVLLFSQLVGIPVEPPPDAVAVSSLLGSNTRATRSGWSARVTATVRRVSGGPVDGAVIKGAFAPGGNVQCTTSRQGTCVFGSTLLPSTLAQTVFTVTNVTVTGAVYDASQNAASQVTVIRH